MAQAGNPNARPCRAKTPALGGFAARERDVPGALGWPVKHYDGIVREGAPDGVALLTDGRAFATAIGNYGGARRGRIRLATDNTYDLIPVVPATISASDLASHLRYNKLA